MNYRIEIVLLFLIAVPLVLWGWKWGRLFGAMIAKHQINK